MASKHKAAHEFTIASVQDETAFHRFVERHWLKALGLALVVTAGILVRTHLSEKARETADASWDRLREDVQFGSLTSPLKLPEPAILAGLATELEDQQAGPWAKAMEISSRVQGEDYRGAERALQELEERWPDHPLVQRGIVPGAEGRAEPLPAYLESRLSSIEAWEGQHPNVHQEPANPALPADAPRVKLVTTAGDIVVGLYTQFAPRHAENFLKLCREGEYDGTLFHRVVKGFMIQGGDPNTKGEDSDPATWGLGGMDYKLDPEISVLRHTSFVLSAAKQAGDPQSSASQFFLTTERAAHLDGQHTVFGAVVAGQDVVRTIESAPVQGERPLQPVRIVSTEVL